MSRKAGVNIAIVVVALATGLYLSRKPWEVYREQQSRANEANQEMVKAEQSREDLERQAAALASPLGRETQARKEGYRRTGETPADREPHQTDGAPPSQ